MTDTNTGTMPDTEPPVTGAADTTESFAEHVFGSVLGAMELLGIYLGDRLGWYRALPLYGADDAVGRVSVPVHIVWGDRDRFLDARLAQASAQLCEQARITHLPDATHWLHHEMPQAVTRLLLDALG